MIPEIFIQAWRRNALWQTYDQIEQDLIISRALIDLYNDPHVSEALVFRDEFLKNLELKRNHQAFQADMKALLPVGLNWSFEEAYQFVVTNIISKLP